VTEEDGREAVDWRVGALLVLACRTWVLPTAVPACPPWRRARPAVVGPVAERRRAALPPFPAGVVAPPGRPGHRRGRPPVPPRRRAL